MDNKLDRFVDDILTCHFSPQGCEKFSVRQIAVIENEDNPNEVSLFMLCRNHAVVFQPPKGVVVFDKTVGSEAINALKEIIMGL